MIKGGNKMSTETEKLELFKYNPQTDGEQTFNISLALNNNWDKIDENAQEVESALNNKVNISTLTGHTSNTNNPHAVTKVQVGLGNVDNTSDLNKPISTAMQTALNAKANDNAVVHLTGNETIGGTKMFTENMWLQTGSDAMLGIKSTNINWTQTPLNDVAIGKILFFDANHYEVGFLQSVLGQYNRSISIGSKNSSDTGWAFLSIGHDNSNNVYTYCPPCDFINSILTTTGINKSQNGYVKLGNGIIIQWGETTGNNGTVTLPTAFTEGGFKVLVTEWNPNGISEPRSIAIIAKTLTTFSYSAIRQESEHGTSYSSTWLWLAIGY